MNKRGQVPILMLFLVAVVLVIAALVSFTIFPRDFGDKSLVVSRTISGVQSGEEYVAGIAKIIAKEAIKMNSDIPKADFEEVASRKDYSVQEAGNFFGKIRNGEFVFKMVEGERYLLKVSGLFVRSSYGYNEMKRNFDLCMLFDKNGNYIGKSLAEAAYSANC
ncbi:MAG: hypothetical protein QXS38_00160 [Candidatus Pacearchaeota archaeon]